MRFIKDVWHSPINYSAAFLLGSQEHGYREMGIMTTNLEILSFINETFHLGFALSSPSLQVFSGK